jgi:Integrase core domain
MPAPKKYPDELRERGVRLALESDRSVAQAELAIVEWVSWFNHGRLHSSIGIPPAEFEQNYAERIATDPPPGSPRPTGSLAGRGGEQPEPLPSSVKLQSTEAT